MSRTFVGFGFGPIQSALFLYEAFRAGKFERLVVAEVAGDIVQAVRQGGGDYTINVAGRDQVTAQTVHGLEIYNSTDLADQTELVAAIAESAEIATALPAVEFFGRGRPSPSELLAAGLTRKRKRAESSSTLVYAAENHLQAAEMLRDRVRKHLPSDDQDWFDENVQFANTVIGKMSGIVEDSDEMANSRLQPMVEGGSRAVLVEEFNHILIERVRLPNFTRCLTVFEEKDDLQPFEEAKLFGHNAAHALLGYLAQLRGHQFMSEVRGTDLLGLVRRAFVEESGAALCRRHQGVDALFTEVGWNTYVTDLLERMTNPHLRDKVGRIVRDPARKLGWNDRLIGTMRLALDHDIQPTLYARGAAAAMVMLVEGTPNGKPAEVLANCWTGADGTTSERQAVAALIMDAYRSL